MKKHLIAAAVAAAVAVPAMAQVTVSGYIEAGYQDLTLSGAAADKTANDSKAFVGGIFGSSRLVFSGSEDLGGGLKAGFRLESSLDVVNGRMGASVLGASTGGTPNNGELFNRGAELNLSGAFGMVRIGQFDHQGGENTDLNVVGNIGLASGMSNANDTATGVEIGTDRKGTIAYRTPTMGGIFVEAAHSTEDGQKIAAGTDSTVGSVSSFYAQGAVGSLGFRVGYAKQEAIGATTGTNNTASRTGGGIMYDFGMASASLHYAKATLISQVENKETVLTLNVPLGGGLDLRGVYRNLDTSDNAAAALATADRREYTIAVAKALSKRTSAYGAYTSFDRTSTAALGNTDSKRVFLGVGHSF